MGKKSSKTTHSTAPAVGYCRVSTLAQAHDGVSLQAQRDAIESWAQAQGRTLEGVYSDDGISGGKTTNRPGLQAAMEHALAEHAVFVVYSLSRATRSTRDALAIVDTLGKGNADFASLSEAIDTSTPQGKAFFSMTAVFAELERDMISDRTKAALQHKRQQGERVGTVPYGHRLDDDGKTLVPIRREQNAIRIMQRMRADGRSYQSVCDILKAKRIKPKTGKTWYPATVKRIIERAAQMEA